MTTSKNFISKEKREKRKEKEENIPVAKRHQPLMSLGPFSPPGNGKVAHLLDMCVFHSKKKTNI